MVFLLFEEVECGSFDNNCFCRCMASASGRDVGLFEAALNRKSGEMVDIDELLAEHDNILRSSDDGQSIKEFIELLKWDKLCLKIFLKTETRPADDEKTYLLINDTEPRVHIGDMEGRVIRLLHDKNHYSRLVQPFLGQNQKKNDLIVSESTNNVIAKSKIDLQPPRRFEQKRNVTEKEDLQNLSDQSLHEIFRLKLRELAEILIQQDRV